MVEHDPRTALTTLEQLNGNESTLNGLANHTFWWMFLSALWVIGGVGLWSLEYSGLSINLWGQPIYSKQLLLGDENSGMELVLLIGWFGYLIAALDQLAERYLGMVALKSYEQQMLRPAEIVASFYVVIGIVIPPLLWLNNEIPPNWGTFIAIIIGTLAAGLPMDNPAHRSDLTPLWARIGLIANLTLVTLLIALALWGWVGLVIEWGPWFYLNLIAPPSL